MSNSKDKQEPIRTGAIAVAVVTWSAILIGFLMVLAYLNCQHTGDRIIDCVKQGKDPESCRKAFDHSPSDY